MSTWIHWKESPLNELSHTTKSLWIQQGKIPKEAIQYRNEGRAKKLYVDIDIVTKEFIDSKRKRPQYITKHKLEPEMTEEEILRVIKAVGWAHAGRYISWLEDA